MKVLAISHTAISHGAMIPTVVERHLYEAALRAVRSAAVGRLAVVLHLSRLRPPAPRPHHRRIMRALLQETAGRYDGQVFGLANGDLVLLCRAARPVAALGGAQPPASLAQTLVAEPEMLPEFMERLLQADRANAGDLVSLWSLVTEGDRLLGYVRERLAQGVGGLGMSEDIAAQAVQAQANARGQPPDRTHALHDAVAALVGTAGISDLMQRQTAILLGGAAERAGGLQPLFREVSFSIAALEGRIPAVSPGSESLGGSDPFLFRHLAARLDQRVLAVLCDEIGRGGPLDLIQALPGNAPMLHLNLTVPGILSPGFGRLVGLCAGTKLRFGVEISLLEATSDSQSFAEARSRLAEAGIGLVLDGVSHLALLLSQPWALRPALLKLDWSPRLPELPEEERQAIDAALAQIGTNKVVLHHAETEAALRWGLAHGIRRFQGRHVDAMLGASRIVSCGQAEGCTLRQCIERAGAAGRVGRAGCVNPALLDAGAPAAAPTAAPAERVA
jgi:EAL domain-containing protein (putative c-di-GMP-specific phosphodiesterase class I)